MANDKTEPGVGSSDESDSQAGKYTFGADFGTPDGSKTANSAFSAEETSKESRMLAIDEIIEKVTGKKIEDLVTIVGFPIMTLSQVFEAILINQSQVLAGGFTADLKVFPENERVHALHMIAKHNLSNKELRNLAKKILLDVDLEISRKYGGLIDIINRTPFSSLPDVLPDSLDLSPGDEMRKKNQSSID